MQLRFHQVWCGEEQDDILIVVRSRVYHSEDGGAEDIIWLSRHKQGVEVVLNSLPRVVCIRM